MNLKLSRILHFFKLKKNEKDNCLTSYEKMLIDKKRLPLIKKIDDKNELKMAMEEIQRLKQLPRPDYGDIVQVRNIVDDILIKMENERALGFYNDSLNHRRIVGYIKQYDRDGNFNGHIELLFEEKTLDNSK